MVCRLPKLYPLKAHPDVLVRSLSEKTRLSKQFPQDLSKFAKDSHEFDSSILNIIEWIKEKIGDYLNATSTEKEVFPDSNGETPLDTSQGKPTEFSRMFVYSHHIFSVEKRREVVNIARDLNLTGFLMPGKPGAICVEGPNPEVQEFWARLRSIPWQKLQMKVIDILFLFNRN